MDQWTGKSINLLMNAIEGEGVALDPRTGLVIRTNPDATYEWFCRSVEEIGDLLGCNYLQAEEYIFSNGGRNKGAWRKYVYEWFKDHSRRISSRRQPAMDFSEILTISITTPMRCNTLTGDDYFTYQRQKRHLVLTLSNGESTIVTRQDWNMVMDRFKSLGNSRWEMECYMPGSESSNWNESPIGLYAACLPALVRQWKSVE